LFEFLFVCEVPVRRCVVDQKSELHDKEADEPKNREENQVKPGPGDAQIFGKKGI
jgi:hypothetical protein